MLGQPLVEPAGGGGQMVEFVAGRRRGGLQGGVEDQAVVGGAGEELPGDPLVQQPDAADIALGGDGHQAPAPCPGRCPTPCCTRVRRSTGFFAIVRPLSVISPPTAAHSSAEQLFLGRGRAAAAADDDARPPGSRLPSLPCGRRRRRRSGSCGRSRRRCRCGCASAPGTRTASRPIPGLAACCSAAMAFSLSAGRRGRSRAQASSCHWSAAIAGAVVGDGQAASGGSPPSRPPPRASARRAPVPPGAGREWETCRRRAFANGRRHRWRTGRRRRRGAASDAGLMQQISHGSSRSRRRAARCNCLRGGNAGQQSCLVKAAQETEHRQGRILAVQRRRPGKDRSAGGDGDEALREKERGVLQRGGQRDVQKLGGAQSRGEQDRQRVMPPRPPARR